MTTGVAYWGNINAASRPETVEVMAVSRLMVARMLVLVMVAGLRCFEDISRAFDVVGVVNVAEMLERSVVLR